MRRRRNQGCIIGGTPTRKGYCVVCGSDMKYDCGCPWWVPLFDNKLPAAEEFFSLYRTALLEARGLPPLHTL